MKNAIQNTLKVDGDTYELISDLAEKLGMSKAKVLASVVSAGIGGLSASGKRLVSGNPEAIEEEGRKLAKVSKLHNELDDDELIDKVAKKVANNLAKANEEPATFGLVEEEDDTTYSCGKCEAELDGKVSFCPECGVELKWEDNPDNKKTGGSGVLGVGLAVLVGLSLLSRAQNNRA